MCSSFTPVILILWLAHPNLIKPARVHQWWEEIVNILVYNWNQAYIYYMAWRLIRHINKSESYLSVLCCFVGQDNETPWKSYCAPYFQNSSWISKRLSVRLETWPPHLLLACWFSMRYQLLISSKSSRLHQDKVCKSQM